MDILKIQKIWHTLLTKDDQAKIDQWIKENIIPVAETSESCQAELLNSTEFLQKDALPQYGPGEQIETSSRIIIAFRCKLCKDYLDEGLFETGPEMMILEHVLENHLKQILGIEPSELENCLLKKKTSEEKPSETILMFSDPIHDT